MTNGLSDETAGFVDRAEEILVSLVGPDKAAEVMAQITAEFKSSTVYIAAERWKIRDRNAWIRKNFKGDYEEMKKLVIEKFKINLSVRHLRRIV